VKNTWAKMIGKYLMTIQPTSFNNTWTLWMNNKGKFLKDQEGTELAQLVEVWVCTQVQVLFHSNLGVYFLLLQCHLRLFEFSFISATHKDFFLVTNLT